MKYNIMIVINGSLLKLCLYIINMEFDYYDCFFYGTIKCIIMIIVNRYLLWLCLYMKFILFI